jgi:hypothetical protein
MLLVIGQMRTGRATRRQGRMRTGRGAVEKRDEGSGGPQEDERTAQWEMAEWMEDGLTAITAPYRRECWMWPAVVLLERLLVVLVFTFDTDAASQAASFTVLFIMFVYGHVMVRPIKSRSGRMVEVVGLGSLVGMSLVHMGSMFEEENGVVRRVLSGWSGSVSTVLFMVPGVVGMVVGGMEVVMKKTRWGRARRRRMEDWMRRMLRGAGWRHAHPAGGSTGLHGGDLELSSAGRRVDATGTRGGVGERIEAMEAELAKRMREWEEEEEKWEEDMKRKEEAWEGERRELEKLLEGLGQEEEVAD